MRALALSDRLDAGLRHWLYLAKPQLDVAQLQLRGQQDGPLWVQGELQSLGFASVGNSPGLRGLGGRFEGDADGFSLQLQPQRSCSSIGRPVSACVTTCTWPGRSSVGATRPVAGASAPRQCVWKAPTTLPTCAVVSGSRAMAPDRGCSWRPSWTTYR
ncbi:hypothetical protein B0X78_13420 [bacterium AM6]|nr:hypothetical protein B0X78_13420 [bacterium AM6]